MKEYPLTYIFTCLLTGFVLSAIIFRCAEAQTFQPLYPDPLVPGGHSRWADYDKDGDPDLITSGVLRNGTGKTILYRNDSGDFIEVAEDFDNFTGFVQWIDLENDGDPDLVIYDSEIRIFINENGIFVNKPRSGYYNFLTWENYDNNQEPDLFGVTNDAILLMVKDNGTLMARTIMQPIQEVTQINVADYNLDGYHDILIKKGPVHDVSINLYINDGNGYFSIDSRNSFAKIPIGTLKSFDYDDDGDQDILLRGKVNDEDTRSAYLYDNENGLFQLSSDTFFQTGYPHVLHLNADHKIDVSRANAADDSVLYYENKGDGDYRQIKNSILSQFNEILSLEYASANGEAPDSYLCISGTLYNGNWATRIYHLENGEFRDLYFNPFDQFFDSRLMQWVDYDKDGYMDAYASGSTQGGHGPYGRLFKNTGSAFEHAVELPYELIGKGDWTDFNLDGQIDLITVVNREVLLCKGFDGSDPITVKKLFSNVDPDAYPKVIDFDKDGDNDVFIDGYLEGIYVNTGDVFTKSITFAPGYSNLGASDWADYDRDGDQDMIMYADLGSTERVRLYRNSNNTFQEVNGLSFPPLDFAYVHWLDYNLDEYPDLFIFGVDNGKVVPLLYKNREGTLSAESVSAFSKLTDLNTYPPFIKVADINNDGYPDLMIGGQTSNEPKMLMYLNNNGVFELRSDHGIPSLFDANFDWADFDNDGDSDILLSGRYDYPKTQVYLNTMEDIYGPTIKSLSPADNKTLYYQNGYKLTLQFHEPVVKGTGTLRIHRKSDGHLLAQVSVSESSTVVNGNTAEIVISDNPFDNMEEIFILMDEGFLKDAHDNISTGISDAAKWNLTIQNSKADQNISFPRLPAVQLTGPSFNLAATTSSGLQVSYSSSDPSVVTISGSMVTIVGVGTSTISASQAGNGEYNSAPTVQQQLVVTKVWQRIIFDPIPPKSSLDAPFVLTATATSGLPVVYSIVNPSVASINQTTVTIHAVGETIITASQPGNNVFEVADPVTQALVVDAITGIERTENHFILYPNPAGNQVTIGLSEAIQSRNITVWLYDSQGLVLRRETMLATKEVNLALEPLAPGIYMIHIVQENTHWKKRFIKL